MAAPVVANILYGPGVVWFRTVDSTFNPSSLDAVPLGSNLPSPWNRFGFTEGPTSFQYEREEKDIMSNESLAPVIRFPTMEKATIGFTVIEVTPGLFNIAAGLDFATTTGSGWEQWVTGDVKTLVERMYCIESTYRNAAGVAYPVRLYIWRGTAKITNSLEWEREGQPKLQVEVGALGDLQRIAGQRLFAIRKLKET